MEEKFSYGHILSSNDGSVEEECIRWGGGEGWASCCNTGFEENKPQPPGHVPGCQASDSPELLLVSDHSYSLFSLGLNHGWKAYFVYLDPRGLTNSLFVGQSYG